ncbi:MAG: sigma-70 family RNA polymerase sigma factor [Verrucomicrobiales bacterium]|nr:sigma-70 family RNA polymerase sigma factor [Verrucomicrobiales bacterium]
MSEVTRLLDAVERGESQAAEELLPLVYGELRRLAAVRMAAEKPGQTLQATALVHEAWLRLAGNDHQQWRGRTHFFRAAAEAMRRILIDRARSKAAAKRGDAVPLEELHESRLVMRAPESEALAVNEALDELSDTDPVAAQVVKLRYFAGMTVPEIAQVLGVSERTVHRNWAYARSWLKGAIRDGETV